MSVRLWLWLWLWLWLRAATLTSTLGLLLLLLLLMLLQSWILQDSNGFISKLVHCVECAIEVYWGQEISLLETVGIVLLDKRQPHSFRWRGWTRDWIDCCL